VALAVFAAVFTTYYFLLPVFQVVFLPPPPANGWLVRPIQAFHFCAAAAFSIFTMPLLGSWMQRRGLAPAPTKLPGKRSALPLILLVKGGLLVIVYVAAGVFYFSAYTSITDEEIEIQNLVNPRRYGMGDVVSLVEIPEGFRVEARHQNGPVLDLNFRDGTRSTMSLDCEGLTEEDLRAIRGMLAEKTGKPWQRDPRAVPLKG
jgi:hypothetical protein